MTIETEMGVPAIQFLSLMKHISIGLNGKPEIKINIYKKRRNIQKESLFH